MSSTKCNFTSGTRKQTILYILEFSILLSALIVTANGQRFRRPAASSQSGLDAYRQRWLEYLKLRATTPPSSPDLQVVTTRRTVTNSATGLVINGFQCERTFALFRNKDNPRRYHLCARSRDNWYVYHYFCPHGTVFDDTIKKCVQDKYASVRPTVSPSKFTTTVIPAPTTSSTTISATTTTTNLESEVTESIVISSEESSTEEEGAVAEKDVHVYDPNVSTSFSDELVEEVTKENDEGSDASNIIPESDNEPSRLSSPTTTQVQRKKPTEKKSATSLKMKHTLGGSNAAGGRRPRILKKWRGYISKY